MALVIAVDGTAGSGKGTLCRALAMRHEWLPLESGLFYRSIARAVQNKPLEEVLKNHGFDDLQDDALRSEEVAMMASKTSANSEVRDCVNRVLRSLAEHLPPIYQGMIVDGRDIGTVVFPDADVKFFLTADAEVRQQRRCNEVGEGQAVDVAKRDEQDTTRAIAPLAQAEGACVIDTTHLSIEEVRDEAERWIAEKLGDKAPAGIRLGCA